MVKGNKEQKQVNSEGAPHLGYSLSTFWSASRSLGGQNQLGFSDFDLLLIVGPVVGSDFSEGRLISRMDMITLYSNKIGPSGENYIRRGEVICKVAVRLSTLIFLAAFLKNKTRS